METYKENLAKYKEIADKAKADGKKPPPGAGQSERQSESSVGALQRHDRAAHPYGIRGHLVPGRIERRSGLPVSHAVSADDPTARRLEAGRFSLPVRALAPFRAMVQEPQESDWAELREAELLTTKLPFAGMAVITDVGEERDIDPRKKEPVGSRLALAARAGLRAEDRLLRPDLRQHEGGWQQDRAELQARRRRIGGEGRSADRFHHRG